MRSTTMKMLFACLAATVMWAGVARADFAVSVAEDGGPATVIPATSGSNGTITLSGFYASAPDFTFVNFNATSNSGTPADQGQIGGTGSIISASPGPHSLTLLVSDSGFGFPSGPNYQMGSSSSYTASGAPATDSASFQSFAASGTNLFSQDNASPGHTYPSLGLSDSFNETPNTLFSASAGYTLTEKYIWNSTGMGTVFQPTGSTVVATDNSAVPEPSSVVLLGLGSLGAALTIRRRLGT